MCSKLLQIAPNCTLSTDINLGIYKYYTYHTTSLYSYRLVVQSVCFSASIHLLIGYMHYTHTTSGTHLCS